MERHSIFSLFCAAIAQLALMAGLLWAGAMIFVESIGSEAFNGIPPYALLLAGLLCFFVTHLFLKKGGNAVLLLLLDGVLIAGAVWLINVFYQVGNTVLLIFCVISLVFSVLCQIKWEIGTFRDATMMMQLQVCFLIAGLQIWLGSQLQMYTVWTDAVFFSVFLLLCGLLASKLAGIQSEKEGGKVGVGKAGIYAIFAGGAALFIVLIGVVVEPVGKFFIRFYQWIDGFLNMILTGIGRVLQFFFARNRVRLDESEAGTSDATTGDGAGGGGFDGDLDVFRIIFHGIILCLILLLIFGLLRLLFGMTLGAKRKIRSKTGVAAGSVNLWERFLLFIREIMVRIRVGKVLRKNKESVAALLIYLEKQCNKAHADFFFLIGSYITEICH